MLGLENLQSHTESNVARLLDATVDVDIAVVDDEEEQIRWHGVLVASLVPDLLDHLTTISKVTGTHLWLLAMLRVGGYKSTVGFVDLDELLEGGFNGLRRRAATTLDTADTPRVDRTFLVVHGELATVEPLATGDHVRRLDGDLLGTGAEMNGGQRKDTNCHLGGRRANLQAVVTKVGIRCLI